MAKNSFKDSIKNCHKNTKCNIYGIIFLVSTAIVYHVSVSNTVSPLTLVYEPSFAKDMAGITFMTIAGMMLTEILSMIKGDGKWVLAPFSKVFLLCSISAGCLFFMRTDSHIINGLLFSISILFLIQAMHFALGIVDRIFDSVKAFCRKIAEQL